MVRWSYTVHILRDLGVEGFYCKCIGGQDAVRFYCKYSVEIRERLGSTVNAQENIMRWGSTVNAQGGHGEVGLYCKCTGNMMR